MLEKPEYFILNPLQLFIKKVPNCTCEQCVTGPITGFVLGDNSDLNSYHFYFFY